MFLAGVNPSSSTWQQIWSKIAFKPDAGGQRHTRDVRLLLIRALRRDVTWPVAVVALPLLERDLGLLAVGSRVTETATVRTLGISDVSGRRGNAHPRRGWPARPLRVPALVAANVHDEDVVALLFLSHRGRDGRWDVVHRQSGFLVRSLGRP